MTNYDKYMPIDKAMAMLKSDGMGEYLRKHCIPSIVMAISTIISECEDKTELLEWLDNTDEICIIESKEYGEYQPQILGTADLLEIKNRGDSDDK